LEYSFFLIIFTEICWVQ